MRGAFPSIGLVAAFMFASCARSVDLELPITEQPTVRPSMQPVPPTVEPPPKDLIVCMGREPESLYRYNSAYLYGDTAREAETVLQAIYDGPLDVRNYEYHSVLLEKLPNLEDGDARVDQVPVIEGDLYLNPVTLLPESLEVGDPYLPAGCQSSDCILTFAGGTVSMDQMVVEFRLLPDVLWSDGEPVAAGDSVFSYELDRNIDTPTTKTQVDRTASYESVDSRTVRWIGIPGYKDAEYFANYWSPLPAHQLGELSAAEMLTATEVNFSPMGWGPYTIEEWRPGDFISLRKNNTYFRADEGLPTFDTLQFRFLADGPEGSIEQLLTHECDVLDESAIADAIGVELIDPEALADLSELTVAGRINLAWTGGAEMERLDFGLAPVPAAGTPGLFDDLRTRAALAACVDRERIVAEVLFGFGEIPDGFLPPSHPLNVAQLESIDYDPPGAKALLDDVGWLDQDEDPTTPRLSSGVAGVPNGTPLSFTYLTTPDALHRSVAARLEADLAACGAEMRSEFLAPEDLFQPWPDGQAFGRTFQAVGWAWPSWVSPLCEMFAGREIPSDENPFGVNASGYRDPDYDQACSALLLGRPDGAAYAEAAERVQTIFRESLPAIPLYMRPRVLAHRASICGIDIDPLSFSALWNIESLDIC